MEKESAMRRSEWLDTLRQDIVYSVRQMQATRSLTAAALLTLALGIGGTTAIFSVVNAVLLRTLPYADPDRVVVVWETLREFTSGRASVGHFYDWTEQTQIFDATSAWQGRTYNLTNEGDPERVVGATVTPGFFRVQYMPPVLGRYFQPDESEARVTVLSYRLWQQRYGGDRNIVGKDITINGQAHTVIGITPAGYTLTQFDEQLWTPLSFAPDRRSNYGAHSLLVMGKLKPGVTLERAQAELERVTEGIRQRQPDNMQERGVRVEALAESLVGGYRTQLFVLLGAVAFVLLIACGNVASLLLARATARRKEIAIRGALGGGRARLVRQLLTESLALALVGGFAGLVVAHFGIRFLAGMGPAGVPRLQEAGLQLSVLGFAFAITVTSGLLFGLAPALRATRSDLQSTLREGGKSSRGFATRDRLRGVLVVTEIAVALVLLVSAGLFIRSALSVNRVPLGFNPTGVTMLRVALPQDRYEARELIESTFARMLENLRAVPGVQSAAFSNRVPMWGQSVDMGVRVLGREYAAGQSPFAHVRLVSSDFLSTLGIPLKQGRLLTERDADPGAPSVVVINETLARMAFGESNPIGQRLSGWTSQDAPEWREVVGVVGDVRAFGREAITPPEVFIPYTKGPEGAWNAFQRSVAFVVRTRGELSPATLRQAVTSVDPLLPLYDVQSMDEVLAQSTSLRRFNTWLLTLLGATGLILAAIGIYGVIAFFVSQRRNEIGIRLALGATAGDVVRLFVTQGAALAGLGVLLGSAAAFGATRTLSTMLFEVTALDPMTYIACAVLLAAIALAATFIPARRAARVHPMESLTAT
jgi:predicted permease